MNEIRRMGFYDDENTLLVGFELNDGQWYLDQPFGVKSQSGIGVVKQSLGITQFGDAGLLRHLMVKLEGVLEDAAALVANRARPGFIWFHWSTDGEATKRTLVYGGEIDIMAGADATANIMNEVMQAEVQFTRHSAWENLQAELIDATGVSTLGGQVTIAPEGTLPGRISKLEIGSYSGAASERLWVGVRERGFGTADFVSVWNATDGAESAGTMEADGWEHDFALDETAILGGVRAQDVVADASVVDFRHFLGTYLILCQLQAASGDEFFVNVGNGSSFGADFGAVLNYQSSGAYVTGDGADELVELGIVQLPSIGNKTTLDNDTLKNLALGVRATCLAGSTRTLTVKKLVLIPAAHMLRSNSVYLAALNSVFHHTTPDDRAVTYGKFNTSVRSDVDAANVDFYAPREGGVLVVAFAPEGGAVSGATCAVDVEIVRRWRSYRSGPEARMYWVQDE